MTACTVLSPDEFFFFFCRVAFLPEIIDGQFSVRAGVDEHMGDFVFGDAVPDFRHLCHIGTVFLPGQL